MTKTRTARTARMAIVAIALIVAAAFTAPGNGLKAWITGPGLNTAVGDSWKGGCPSEACLWPESDKLGTGVVVLGGHSVTHGEVFANLDRMRVGDVLTIDSADHHTYTYRVVKREKINETFEVQPSSTPELILVTCASKVVHTVERWAITAELVNSQ